MFHILTNQHSECELLLGMFRMLANQISRSWFLSLSTLSRTCSGQTRSCCTVFHRCISVCFEKIVVLHLKSNYKMKYSSICEKTVGTCISNCGLYWQWRHAWYPGLIHTVLEMFRQWTNQTIRLGFCHSTRFEGRTQNRQKAVWFSTIRTYTHLQNMTFVLKETTIFISFKNTW